MIMHQTLDEVIELVTCIFLEVVFSLVSSQFPFMGQRGPPRDSPDTRFPVNYQSFSPITYCTAAVAMRYKMLNPGAFRQALFGPDLSTSIGPPLKLDFPPHSTLENLEPIGTRIFVFGSVRVVVELIIF